MLHQTGSRAAERPRRRLLVGALGALLAGTQEFAAAAPTPPQMQRPFYPLTPQQMQGPFYPLTLPLDQDNDLVQLAGRPGLAHGMIIEVSGLVLDPAGQPIRGARVEIWQVNGFGRYHHPDDDSPAPVDPSFQGFGRTLTDKSGAYHFRTIRPVAYPSRAPHIHFAVTPAGGLPFHTQMYVAGEPANGHDFLLNAVRDRRQREALIVPLRPSPTGNSRLAGRFDIVLGPVNIQRER
jgi:protocatechuate 3,4-dioxygenase beta subunit